MSKQKIILVGYSGHSLVVSDCLSNEQEIFGYFDLSENLENPLAINYLGLEQEFDFSQLDKDTFLFPSVGNNLVRESVCRLISEKGLRETNIIHSSAVISKFSEISGSTLIGPGSIVNSRAKVGRGVIINSGAIIEHEVKIGDYSHVAPGAVLAGNVSIGKSVFVGANSVCKQGVFIGDRAVIGAGSVVLNDVPSGEIWVGNPAKKLNK